MNKIVRAMGLITLAAMVVATAVSCDGFYIVFSVSGKVVNAMAPGDEPDFWKGTKSSSATLEGAQITLTNKGDGDDYHGTVEDDGTFVIAGVGPGKYTLSGVKDDWSFVDREVDITGFAGELPDVLAYETPDDLDEILVMVEWQNDDMDVDSYITRDNDDYDANDYDGLIIAGYAGGDVTGGNNPLTEESYFVDPEGLVTLERDIIQVDPDNPDDVALPRVETIKITGSSIDSYETLRYYIRLFNYYDASDSDHDDGVGTLTGSGGGTHPESSEATVFVMQGRTNLGTYRIAVNSNEIVLGVLQMQWDFGANEWIIGSYSNPGFDSDDWTDLGGVRSFASAPVAVESIK